MGSARDRGEGTEGGRALRIPDPDLRRTGPAGAAGRDGTARVHTWNAAENVHMLAINAALGFREVGAQGGWQLRAAPHPSADGAERHRAP